MGEDRRKHFRGGRTQRKSNMCAVGRRERCPDEQQAKEVVTVSKSYEISERDLERRGSCRYAKPCTNQNGSL